MSEQSSRWYLFHAWGKGTCRKQYLRWQRVVRNHGDCLGTLSQRERVGSELAVRFGLRFQIKTVAWQKKRFCRKQTGRFTHQADYSGSIGLDPTVFTSIADRTVGRKPDYAKRFVASARFCLSVFSLSRQPLRRRSRSHLRRGRSRSDFETDPR
jgi:hypothetical protein